MAKGRKLTISRSERYLGNTYTYNQTSLTDNDISELSEEDLWPVVDESVNDESDDQLSEHREWSTHAVSESIGGGGGGLGTRNIPRREGSGRHVAIGGLSVAFDDDCHKTAASRILHQYRSHSPRGHQIASSAPVNVPDWTKIYRVDSVESMPDSDDDKNMDVVPPHEYLARVSSRNSVFEGVGRTLKGRDLRRVRDAVWSQTGFNG